MGYASGFQALNTHDSNFFGNQAGYQATNANNSNFFGINAGRGASNASYSNFFGEQSGYGATGATNSNFFGQYAGYLATNASYSTLIGYFVGNASGLGSLGSNNIIIGKNISLPSGTTNSINLGGVLFGTGTYSSLGGNPSITAQTQGKIGINVVSPVQAFEVSGDTRLYGGLTANTISATTYLNLPAASFSGGTVTGPTQFTNGLTANTISATTYLNLPLDIRVTGGTYDNPSGTAVFTNNTGGTFNITGFTTGSTSGGQTENFNWKFSTTTISGDPSNGYFRANNAIPSGITQLYVSDICDQTGFDVSNIFGSISGNFTIYVQQTDDANKFMQFNTSTGYTDNTGWWTIPVTYIQNGSGGLFGNNSKCTFYLVNKNGSTTVDTFVTGFTYSNNILTIQQNQGKSDLSVLINTMTGITATTISATTYLNLPTDIRVTGGTYSSGTTIFTNNTGGTFSVNTNGTPFYTVAASNSPITLKNRADYVCDGTADESEINTALALGNVQLVEGTYNISVTGIQIGANRTLMGVGDGTKLLGISHSATTKMITNTGAVGINLRDFSIDGSGRTMGYGVYFENVGSGSGTTAEVGCFIENLYIKDVYQSAIELRSCRNSNIINCVFDNPNWDGVVLKKKVGDADGSMYININNNIFNNCTASIWCQFATYCNFNNNVFEGDLTNNRGQELVQLEANCAYITIDGNVFRNSGEVHFWANDTVSHIIISNNIFSKSVSDGIWTTANYTTISNNDIEFSGQNGIYIEGDGAIIDGNRISSSSTISNAGYNNISYVFGSNSVISNNIFNRGFEANRPAYGVMVYSSVARCLVSNNNLYNGGLSGDVLNQSSSTRLSNNISLTGGWAAISATTSQYVMNTSKILGRYSGGIGALQELSIGDGLSLSTGGTLTTTGTSGTFTGGTVSGGTNFTNGLTASTISATTYYNLPLDIMVTGGTYSSGTAVFTNNTGGTFNVTGFSTGSTSGTTSPITIVNTSSLFSTGLSGTGSGSTAQYSNFFGVNSGSGATNASNSNFLGQLTGYLASGATRSNFLGEGTGNLATNAQDSNFLGYYVGYSATTANNSNFMGRLAGYQAANANYSNFFGFKAGYQATGASQSILIGASVGDASVLGSLGSNNIIVGSNISLSSGTTNSINLGGVLFGTGTYSSLGGNPSIVPNNGKIGINVVNPTQVFEVSGGTRIYGGLTANTISATTYQGLPLDIYLTGGTYSLGTAIFTNNTGGTFNVGGFSTGGGSFTGGTVTGATQFTDGLSANTISSSTITVSGVTFNKLLLEKVGFVSGATFTGTPRKAVVSFATNFPNTDYAIVITGGASRTYTYEAQTVSGFTINTNANTALSVNTYWMAKQFGEV
jgi:hypothetical protein